MTNDKLFDKIRSAINEQDPIGLLEGGAPKTEYENEAKKVMQSVCACSSVKEVQDLVYNTFVQQFEFGRKLHSKRRYHIDKGGAGKKEDYKRIAEQIYEALSDQS
ncbi:hypothetical protein GOV14_05860 [Candidatus Pacearchaeota archaeon]|nr:hypothetical protein [Candidatus Pacearchaeota archaeon]